MIMMMMMMMMMHFSMRTEHAFGFVQSVAQVQLPIEDVSSKPPAHRWSALLDALSLEEPSDTVGRAGGFKPTDVQF